MAVKDNLIADETVVFESKKHWMAPIRASLVAAAMFIGGAILYRVSPNWDGFFSFVGSILDLLAIALFIGGLGWIIYNVIEWRTAEFAVTNMRVLREEGLASKRSSTTLLSSLSDVKSNVSFLGDKLGYGDLMLLTQSGSAGEDRFLCITTPMDFRNAVMNQKVADRRDGGMAPAPAAAVAAPALTAAGASAAAPAGAPAVAPVAAPAVRSMTSTEAAAAIASLADLRDRGAITSEEYEAKKGELLGRM